MGRSCYDHLSLCHLPVFAHRKKGRAREHYMVLGTTHHFLHFHFWNGIGWDSGPTGLLVIPVAEKAWGWYISYLAIWIPVIHVAAKKRDKAQDKPREIIPRVIPLFKGPAAWNKAER